ncbi:MAG: hypothetical protein WBF18_02395 [Solirubrobacterales bacterium]
MANLTPGQQATRARAEGLIALAAPFLDIVLGVGERISRIAEPTDHEYYPIRAGNDRRLPGEAAVDDTADPDGSAEGPGQD